MDAAKTMLINSIFDNLDMKKLLSGCSNTIRIADFGCSVGANTFRAIQNIIEAIHLKHKTDLDHDDDQNPRKNLELQVFFNDHADNDFNTLFTTLPAPQEYFAAGVPGSFHSRLFPTATLHVAHSSYSLHWLSRVPEEVVDRNSPTWNKWKVHYNGNVKVFEAYSGQFKRDMGVFLSARAQEIVSGGLMLLVLLGSQDGFLPYDTCVSMQYDLLGSCLGDMVKMGKISEEKLDSFNLPLYHPTPMEFKELIEANGNFNIEQMESFNPYMQEGMPDFQILAAHLRAALEGLITGHFGSEIVEELFEHYVKKMAESTYVFDLEKAKQVIIFACLKRKSDW